MDRLCGIVTFAWHWKWKGFYTEGTTFDIEKTLAEPESANYRLMLRDIDAIAVQLKRLQDAAIPVLWRPLHEADGGWFWWDAKGWRLPRTVPSLIRISSFNMKPTGAGSVHGPENSSRTASRTARSIFDTCWITIMC